jgi:ParB family chromosome partitioning protein
VSLIVGLLEKGEVRLIAAVDSGSFRLTLAATMRARSDDAGIQQALADAYADGKIKGKNVELVRRLLERRRRGGWLGAQRFGRSGNRSRPTPDQLVQIFRKEADANG